MKWSLLAECCSIHVDKGSSPIYIIRWRMQNTKQHVSECIQGVHVDDPGVFTVSGGRVSVYIEIQKLNYF